MVRVPRPRIGRVVRCGASLAGALALLLVPSAPRSLAAADPPSAASDGSDFVETLDVEVVNVDVVVTDRSGNLLDGLTAADFEIYEDGERRDLSNFFAFDEGRMVSD